MAIIITILVILALPFLLRWTFAAIGFLFVLAIVTVAIGGARAQSQRTTCYDSGNTRICDTFDSMGNAIAKTRCYQSGRDQRCETQNFSSSSSSSSSIVTPLPIPPLNIPRR